MNERESPSLYVSVLPLTLGCPAFTVRPWIGSEGWEKHVDGFMPKCTQGWGMVRPSSPLTLVRRLPSPLP